MVKCRLSHLGLHREENLGVMKDKGQFYQVGIFRV